MSLFQVIFVIIVPALITGIPSLIAALAAKRRQKDFTSVEQKKTGAEAADNVSNAYQKLVDDLQEQINGWRDQAKIERQQMVKRQDELEKRVDRQSRRIRHLENGVNQLVKQIRSMGEEPVFTLDTTPDNNHNGGE